WPATLYTKLRYRQSFRDLERSTASPAGPYCLILHDGSGKVWAKSPAYPPQQGPDQDSKTDHQLHAGPQQSKRPRHPSIEGEKVLVEGSQESDLCTAHPALWGFLSALPCRSVAARVAQRFESALRGDEGKKCEDRQCEEDRYSRERLKAAAHPTLPHPPGRYGFSRPGRRLWHRTIRISNPLRPRNCADHKDAFCDFARTVPDAQST